MASDPRKLEELAAALDRQRAGRKLALTLGHT